MIKLSTILIFACWLSMLNLVLGQDSIKIESQLSIETRGQHNIAALNSNFDCLNCITGRVEDNPIHHLGLYTGVNHHLILNDKYVLETGIYLEERSFSGGNNTLANLIVFPKILLKAEGDIGKNKSVQYFIKGGDLWNEDIGDMLRIYNIDYQGIMGRLYYKNWAFGFMTIGDLSRNIGLDLHQLYRFSATFEKNNLRNQTTLSINELVSQPFGQHPTLADINMAHYFKYSLSPHSTLEAQADVRLNGQLDPSVSGGLRYVLTKKKFNLTTSFRYYAREFNIGYDGDGPRYFGANRSYIGPQLYPLKNFYRRLSQWALYTHSEEGDLIAIEIAGDWNKTIYKKLSAHMEWDMNVIYNMSQEKGSIYPIYNLGIQFDFLPVFNGRVSVTNRHMELRQRYQTISISQAPFLSLSVQLEIDKLRLRKGYIKV